MPDIGCKKEFFQDQLQDIEPKRYSRGSKSLDSPSLKVEKEPQRMESPVGEAVENALESSQSWAWDAFALAKATDGKPLAALAMFLFEESNLIETFRLASLSSL